MHEKPHYHSLPPEKLPPTVSSLAIVSLLFAVMSPVVLCICGLSLATSLIAIVTGHVALVRIRNAAGGMTGRGMAIAGLVLGYLMLVVTILVVILFFPAIKDQYLRDRQARSDGAVTGTTPSRYSRSGTPITRDITVLEDVPVSREVVREFPKLGWTVKSLAFSPGGKHLAAGKVDRALLIFDLETGATVMTVEGLNNLSSVERVAFSPDGRVVAAAGSNGAVSTWSIDEAGQLSNPQSLIGHERRVSCLAVSSVAPFLLTGSADGKLMWQSYHSSDPTMGQLQALSRAALAIFLPPTGDAALASDGATLVHFDLQSSQVTATHQLPRVAAQSAAFSPDGSQLAVTAGYQVQVWDTATAAPLKRFEAGREMQWSVAFLPGGERLISGGRGFATLWNLQTGKAECRFDLGGIQYIQTLAISSDGTMLAAIPASAGQTLTVLRIPEL